MATTTKTIANVLNSLVETCKDGQEGFRSAAEDVKNTMLKDLFSRLSVERGRFANELQQLVTVLGEEPEMSGSVAASLHRGWIDLKSALSSGDEHAILAECERGEDSAVEEYRDALSHEEIPSSVREVIHRQFIAVKDAHDRVRDLRDAHEK